MMPMQSLFSPIDVGTLSLKNRIVLSSMTTNLGDHEGHVTENMKRYYVARARGGAGLVVVEGASAEPRGRAHRAQLLISDDRFIAGLRGLAQAIKSHGARAALQVNHFGRVAPSRITGEMPVAPSNIPSPLNREELSVPSTVEVEALVERFAQAVRRAREAGFEAVEIMASTGFLINQFLSPCTNSRDDRYGGDLEGRLRFLLEIVARAKELAGDDFPITCKISVKEYLKGGHDISDGQQIAQRLEQAGVASIQAFAGWYESPIPMLPAAVPRGYFVFLAEALKQVVRVPVMTNTRINDPQVADTIVAEGRADLIVMGRALICDPDLPNKAAAERLSEIRRCIACNQGCFERMNAELPITCALNPEAVPGEAPQPAARPKRVMVIGAGPSGLEAARRAAERGHQVTLFDKAAQIGGQVRLAMVPPHKEELTNIVEYYDDQLPRVGVHLRLGRAVTGEDVIAEKPDVVILATGAGPAIPSIPGVERKNVTTAHAVLSGQAEVSGRVVVVGGGMVGVETAEHLATKGCEVTIVEMLKRIALDVGPSIRWTLVGRIGDLGVKALTETTVVEIADDGVIVEGKEGQRQTIAADAVVLAVGARPETSLAGVLEGKVDELYSVGDCSKPGKILEAIHAGAQAGSKV